ncbi:hypothetical protein F4774DRAFT_428024 [Daldinia eschscholtzii]|nr:hypothetical protein F4774DRAFT_428024 [Daldinia eschscholtzii]
MADKSWPGSVPVYTDQGFSCQASIVGLAFGTIHSLSSGALLVLDFRFPDLPFSTNILKYVEVKTKVIPQSTKPAFCRIDDLAPRGVFGFAGEDEDAKITTESDVRSEVTSTQAAIDIGGRFQRLDPENYDKYDILLQADLSRSGNYPMTDSATWQLEEKRIYRNRIPSFLRTLILVQLLDDSPRLSVEVTINAVVENVNSHFTKRLQNIIPAVFDVNTKPSRGKSRSRRQDLKILFNKIKGELRHMYDQEPDNHFRASGNSEPGDASSPSRNTSIFSPFIPCPFGTALSRELGIEYVAQKLMINNNIISRIREATSTEDIELPRPREFYKGSLDEDAMTPSGSARTDFLEGLTFDISYCLLDDITEHVVSEFDAESEETCLGPTLDTRRAKRPKGYIQGILNSTARVTKDIELAGGDSDSTGKENLEKFHDGITGFLFGGKTYRYLLKQLRTFINRRSKSQPRDLLTSWSASNHEYHGYVSRYKLFNLVAELQYIRLSEIRFEECERLSPVLDAMRRCQDTVELWTGETWDWWPLPQCLRPLKEGEVRLRWKCGCGEERWAVIPTPLEQSLREMINSLPQSNLPTNNVRSPAATHKGGRSASTLNQNTASPTQPPGKNQHPLRASGSSSTNTIQTGQRNQAVFGRTYPFSHLVLFVVKRGLYHRLAQIGVMGLSSHDFFRIMRKEYFHLRGFIRSWFSIWRYSHCDFYMCEKIEDYEFVTRQEHVFPEATNHDYEYRPRPMGNIPPVSEHEFRLRFYACHDPRPQQSLLHRYHKCKKFGCHTHNVLHLFPKKKTRLEEAGDTREIFWGIYARERISFSWVLGYNLFCLLPMLAFFIAWILPRGRGADLQNPSVPLSIMMGMLSLFWSLFLSSLQFGKPR